MPNHLPQAITWLSEFGLRPLCSPKVAMWLSGISLALRASDAVNPRFVSVAKAWVRHTAARFGLLLAFPCSAARSLESSVTRHAPNGRGAWRRAWGRRRRCPEHGDQATEDASALLFPLALASFVATAHRLELTHSDAFEVEDHYQHGYSVGPDLQRDKHKI